MSFNKHLNHKLSASKNAINQTWSKFVRNRNILASNKYKMFDAVVKSIMCYGGQVWGFNQYDQVEKLQRFFLKKMFYLPSNTPNYMLSIETGLNNLFAYTLKLHYAYIRKVMTLPDTRLPKILARKAIDYEIYWAKEWKNIATWIDYDFDFSWDLNEWKKIHSNTLEKIIHKQWEGNIDSAKGSIHHDAYMTLEYTNLPNYFADHNPIYMISLIFKTRGGLLDINARSFKNNTIENCDLCNLGEVENTFHFVARCPIFKTFRRHFLGKEILCMQEFTEYLNGKSYELLYLYLKAALNYRKLIVNFFC